MLAKSPLGVQEALRVPMLSKSSKGTFIKETHIKLPARKELSNKARMGRKRH
jgi:hypothetical protein